MNFSDRRIGLPMFKKKSVSAVLDRDKLPAHIAFIMDGNGRWAKKRGLSRSVGHAEGSRRLKKIIDACYQLGIRYATVYAFSSENWARPEEEVTQLMKLLLNYLRNAEQELEGREVRIRVLGDRAQLPKDIQDEIVRVETVTAKNEKMDFLIALNYGGRQEILQAVQRIAGQVQTGAISVSDITPELFANHLYTAGIPDPDLVIRTSGEKRLSNFLIYQAAYSEFMFPEVLWPDFTEAQLYQALIEYQSRNRRFGGV